ncbi:MAG: hypothetical protein ABI675_06600 [Chitinophagaceae bacterium]
MKILLTLSLVTLAFLLPLVTGLIAQESWLWFYISIPLALIAAFIFVCLPGVSTKKTRKLSPVENEEIFNHLFIRKNRRTYITLRNGKSRKNHQQYF